MQGYLKIKSNPTLYKKEKIRVALAVKKWRLKNPEKAKAHNIVYVSLRNGSLSKKPCFCGNLKVEAHHSDYTRPLDIEWLCKKHHVLKDSERRD